MKQKKYELRLYIAGKTPKSITALRNLQTYCEEHLAEQYVIEVIDLLQKEVDKGMERLSRAITGFVAADSLKKAGKETFAPSADKAVMQNLGGQRLSGAREDAKRGGPGGIYQGNYGRRELGVGDASMADEGGQI